MNTSKSNELAQKILSKLNWYEAQGLGDHPDFKDDFDEDVQRIAKVLQTEYRRGLEEAALIAENEVKSPDGRYYGDQLTGRGIAIAIRQKIEVSNA